MLLFSVIGAVHISSWQMLCFSLVSGFVLTRSDVFLTNNCCVFHCYALNFSPIGVLFLTNKRCISHKKSCVLVDNWCLSKKNIPFVFSNKSLFLSELRLCVPLYCVYILFTYQGVFLTKLWNLWSHSKKVLFNTLYIFIYGNV